MSKLFSIKEKDFHKIIDFCGIRFKIFDKKLLNSFLRKMNISHIDVLPQIFLYIADKQLTKSQKESILAQKFYENAGYFPNLRNPKTFNEKINWMKLNYYNPLEEVCIDKYTFKEYIKAKLGEEYVIPLIGVYENVNDIDFDKLPQNFVIKTTANGSARGVEIVKDKSKLNIDKIKYKFNCLLPEWNTIYYTCLSRGYKNIKPRIIIENYVEQKNQSGLYDYKFFCFYGKVKFVEVIKDRKDYDFKSTFYDTNWKKLELKSGVHKTTIFDKPVNFDKMIKIAEELSKEFPFVRVDLYNVDGVIYIGELTFTPTGGFMRFNPVEWDYKLGEWLDLNKLPKECVIIKD